MKKIVSIILVMSLMYLLVSTVAFAVDQEETVIFSRAEEVNILHPFNGALGTEIMKLLMYDRLIEYNYVDDKYYPGLAESWEVSEDELSITFHLREGIKFHNGQPFTSEDVKVTLEILRDNPTLRRASALGPNQIEEVEILDDYTCVLHMKEVYAPLWETIGNFIHIVPSEAYKEFGIELFEHPIGTGPYKFVELQPDISMTVEANRDYWNEQYFPRVDKIIYKPIMEPATQLAALLIGELDILDMVHPDQAPILEKNTEVIVERDIVTDGFYYQFNVRNPVLNDVRVRTAIDLATDREGVVEFMNGGAPLWTWSKPGTVGYTPDVRSDYDPDKAREILAETGYSAEELTFILKIPEGWFAKLTEVAVLLQGMMAEVGITFDVVVMEGAVFREHRAQADYDIFITGCASGDIGRNAYRRIVTDDDKSGYVNEELNELLTAAVHSLDLDKRQKLYEQAWEIMMEEKAPHLFFYQMEQIYAYRDRITGFRFAPTKIINLRTIDTIDNPGPVQ